MNNIIKSYNTMLFDFLKSNKATIIVFLTITALGYFSLPHLENYDASTKKEQEQEENKK